MVEVCTSQLGDHILMRKEVSVVDATGKEGRGALVK